MWYVIQTITGQEKELVELIEKMLAKKGYEACFVIQQECVWRIEGAYRVYLKPLFPSYVFVETGTPEEFFFGLKKIPKLSRLLGIDGVFWNVRQEEQELLKRMIDGNPHYIVGRSLVHLNSDGEIIEAGGALRGYIAQIVKKRLRKRVVWIEIPFLGEVKKIQLGIRLAEDKV